MVSLDKGTTEMWDDFSKSVFVIHDEMSLKKTETAKYEVFETANTGVTYVVDCIGSKGKVSFDVTTETNSSNLNDWESIRYWIRIEGKNALRAPFHKQERFRKGKDPIIPMSSWTRFAFYERNIQTKPNLYELFGSRDIRILGLPEHDPHHDFKMILGGAAVIQGVATVLRFRHANINTLAHEGIEWKFSYAIQLDEFWVIFPVIDFVWSTSASLDLREGRKALARMVPDSALRMLSFDIDKEEFMRYAMRYERSYRGHMDYSPSDSSINFSLGINLLPDEVNENYFEKEINRIEDKIWEKDYPHAIRDLRALVEEEARERLREKGIEFHDKDDLHALKSKLIANKVVEGRLDSWFDAFTAFGNKSSHSNYPTREQMKDDIIRYRADVTILIGKQLLIEIRKAK